MVRMRRRGSIGVRRLRAYLNRALLAASLPLTVSACSRRDASRSVSELLRCEVPLGKPSAPVEEAEPPRGITRADPDEEMRTAIDAILAMPLPELPPAPPKAELTGEDALVWIDDKMVIEGTEGTESVESVWIERRAGGARVVAKRNGRLFVSSHDLWVLEKRATMSSACAECDLCMTEPTMCRNNVSLELEEPYLRSLVSGRIIEPWKGHFAPRRGCKDNLGSHTLEFALEGAVGPIIFGWLRGDDQYCFANHPTFFTHVFAYNLDESREIQLGIPPEVLEPLRFLAKRELVTDCVLNPNESPTPFAATAFYAKDGTLRGSYVYTMSAAYVCGRGPDHYTNESTQSSDWVPPELATYGRLPSWVAEFVSNHEGRYAFMIPATLSAAAHAAFERP